MEERLIEKVEGLLKKVKFDKKKKRVVPPEDFIDLLNYSLINSEVEVVYLNKKSLYGLWGHRIKYQECVFGSTTYLPIYDL